MTPAPNDTTQEQRYRSYFLRRDAVSFSLLAGLFILFNLLLFRADATFWASGPVHDALVALRVILILGSALSIISSLRTRNPAVFDRCALAWGVALALTNNLVILSRPASYTGNIVPELVAVFCLFETMPDRGWLRGLPSLLLAAGSLSLLFVVKELPNPVALLSILFSYLAALVMGYRISSSSFRHRREMFIAIEELEEVHREARASEEKFRQLVQNSHGIIYTIDQQGCLDFVSPGWTRLLGHQVDQVSGHDFREFVHPEDIPACEAFLYKTIVTGEAQRGVLYRVFHVDGSLRWHRSNVTPCFDENGAIVSCVGTAVDETDAVNRARQLEEANRALESLSITDGLTGIANRRHFDAVLHSEWTRSSRTRQPLTIIMIDIDFFKRYNDHYGHQAGDECLKQIATVLHSCAQRVSDLVARYGGEEFAVIAANSDGESGRHLAECIRASVESLALPHEDSPRGCVTVSVGVASMARPHDLQPEELLRMADDALYLAKQRGRNRIEVSLSGNAR